MLMIIFFVDQNYKNKNLREILDVKKIEAVDKPIETANGLPNECYTSNDYLAYEKKRIFCDKWTVVGETSSVPNKSIHPRVSIIAALTSTGKIYVALTLVNTDSDIIMLFMGQLVKVLA